MYTAQLGLNFPIAIRYPRGRGSIVDWKQPFEKIKIGTGKCISNGSEIAVLSIGPIGNIISEIKSNKIAHYNMRFIKPLDEKLLHQIFKKFEKIVTLENGTIIGGFGSAILEFANNNNYKNKVIKQLGIPDNFIEHGNVHELFENIHLSKEKIKDFLSDL